MHLRRIITPLTIGGFLLSAATGVLLFFHLDRNLVFKAHIWLSWVLVAGALLHLIVNRKPFYSYLKMPIAISIIITCTFLLVLSVVVPSSLVKKNKQQPNTYKNIRQALLETPLSTIASVTKEPPQRILTRLRKEKIQVEHERQTIQELSNATGISKWLILDTAFNSLDSGK